MAPFLSDKNLVQQGYLGSEPFVIKQTGGFEPVVLLVADGGYNGYSNIITTSRKIVDEKPDLVSVSSMPRSRAGIRFSTTIRPRRTK